jgi:hypothetical protein
VRARLRINSFMLLPLMWKKNSREEYRAYKNCIVRILPAK